MTDQYFPPGWNEERVREVIHYYDAQTEDEAVAEYEAAFSDEDRAIVEVPVELLPIVRDLITLFEARARA